VQEKLKGDVLKRMASPLLTTEDYVALYEAHVAALFAQARQQYLAALDDIVKPAMAVDGVLQAADKQGEAAKDFEAASEALSVCACFHRLAPAERLATWQRYTHDVKLGIANPGAPKPPPMPPTVPPIAPLSSGPERNHTPYGVGTGPRGQGERRGREADARTGPRELVGRSERWDRDRVLASEGGRVRHAHVREERMTEYRGRGRVGDSEKDYKRPRR
jgi:hypothetical protein